MALTETQRNNIHKLDSDDIVQVLYECIERLGVCGQKEFMEITGYKYTRQNLNDGMRKNKVKNVVICGRRLPYIND